jgi:hypothetical protein
LRWRVRIGSRDDAFTMRRQLRETVSDAVIAELERVFDALPIGHDVVHLQRLEAVVRLSRPEDVERACVEAVRAQVVEALEIAVAWRTPSSGQSVARERLDARSSRRGALLRYLETGMLPWHLAPSSSGLSPEQVLELAAGDEWRELVDALPGDSSHAWQYVFRLLALLPPATWADVMRHTVTRRQSPVDDSAVRAMELIAASDAVAPYLRAQAASALVVVIHRGDMTPGVARALPPLGDGAADLIANDLPVPRAIAALFERPPDAAGRAAAADASTDRHVDPDARDAIARLVPPTVHSTPVAERRPAMLQPGPLTPPSSDTGVLLQHAGLVLLVPYLPRLFESRGVIAAGARTIAPSMLPRACALLHAAATGRDGGHEFEIAFAKVLAGLKPDSPVPFAAGLLSSEDRDGVDELLHAVIGHWRAVKRTSIDGLRAAFLQRAGIVEELDRSWHVRMEPSGIDVLIDQLPWGISTQTLPWVTKPITTEWTMR